MCSGGPEPTLSVKCAEKVNKSRGSATCERMCKRTDSGLLGLLSNSRSGFCKRMCWVGGDSQ